MDDNYEYEVSSIMVPILTNELTTLTFVVPLEFALDVETQALQIIESFEKHPAGINMDDNNKNIFNEEYKIQVKPFFDF